MKKFKFFALAFAALSFAACSDDALDGKGGNGGSASDGTPAYLTISFSANTGNSSRVSDSDGDNTGDMDKADDSTGQEDSGHSNSGTTDENAVKRALVVVSPVEGNVGFAKLYIAGESGNLSTATEEGDPEDVFTITDSKSQTYHNADPVEVSTGTYNILVVINPVGEITADTDLEDGLQLTSGPAVRDLYNKIVDGKYTTAAGVVRPATGAQEDDKYITDMGNSTDGFMMANKSLVQKELTSSNTPDNPLEVTLDVERVISKITYRETETGNVYPVEVNTGSVQAKTVRGLVKNTDNDTYILHIFNEARDANETTPKEVYALYVEDEQNEGETEFDGVYRKTDEEITVWTKEGADGTIEVKTEQPMSTDDPDEPDDSYTQETLHVFVVMVAKTQDEYDTESSADNKLNWFVAKDIPAEGQEEGDGTLSEEEIEASLILQLTPGGDGETTDPWYVRLEGYALVNLSKEVNYVRHITDARGIGAPFGTLNGSNFLYTPGFDDKNKIDFDAANFVQTAFETQAEGWYYNPLAQVSEESKSLFIESGAFKKMKEGAKVDAEFYRALPTSTDDNDGDETVTGSGSQHGNPLANIGELMSYCFENSTNIDNQVHGLSTGISFMAKIYTDQQCTKPVDGLYYYGGYIFKSLADIQKALSVNTPQAIKDLIEADENNVTREQLINAGITPYTDNTCYYYTTRIKHFDNNNDSELGNMEFAIMRNNIYSLSVTGIREIGAPFVDPTPSIPNESDEAAISIEVNMVPWIVRYNDIEF